MFTNQYEEHLAHSAPCNSKWDGFDRGTVWADEEFYSETVIGRMTNSAGQRVVITEEIAHDDTFYRVEVDGKCVYSDQCPRHFAVSVARSYMAVPASA